MARDESFDDAVFQRVETDDRQTAAGREHFQGRLEGIFELAQLAVDAIRRA